MDLSTYLGNKIIDHMLRNQSYTPPSTIYLSAHTADPGLTGASEVGTAGSNGYSRQSLALAAGSGKSTSNSSQIQITMPSNLTSNTEVSWLGCWDASTSGNFLFKIPLAGDPFEATVTTADLFSTAVAHNLIAGDRVYVQDLTTLPGSVSTTVTSGSNTTNVNTFSGSGTLNVADTTGYASSGTIYVLITATIAANKKLVAITYSGKTGTTFTGCTTIDSSAGALATGDPVYQSIASGPMYYVISSGLTSSDFKLSASSAGTAVDILVAGGCIIRKVVVQPFNASNTLQIASGALVLSV